jgi:hypothetical protein
MPSGSRVPPRYLKFGTEKSRQVSLGSLVGGEQAFSPFLTLLSFTSP